MYVIIVYDVNVKRVNSVRKYLRQYLNWVQNSVFEGEITPATFERIKYDLKQMVDEDDSIRIYSFKSQSFFKVDEIGSSKTNQDNIL